MSSSHQTDEQHQLLEAAQALSDFNEKSDVQMETMQPLLAEYVELLKVLRSEVIEVNQRAAQCVKRAEEFAKREGTDLSKLKLGQHQEELDREEKSELVE